MCVTLSGETIALNPGHLFVSRGNLLYIKVCDGQVVESEVKNVVSEAGTQTRESNWNSVHKPFDDTDLNLNHQQSSRIVGVSPGSPSREIYTGGYQGVQST